MKKQHPLAIDALLEKIRELEAQGVDPKSPEYRRYFDSMYRKHADGFIAGESSQMYRGVRTFGSPDQPMQRVIDDLATLASDIDGQTVDRECNDALTWIPGAFRRPEKFGFNEKAKRWIRLFASDARVEDFWRMVACEAALKAYVDKDDADPGLRPDAWEPLYTEASLALAFVIDGADEAWTLRELQGQPGDLLRLALQGEVNLRPNGWPQGRKYARMARLLVASGRMKLTSRARVKDHRDQARPRLRRGLAKLVASTRYVVLQQSGLVLPGEEISDYFDVHYSSILKEVEAALRGKTYAKRVRKRQTQSKKQKPKST